MTVSGTSAEPVMGSDGKSDSKNDSTAFRLLDLPPETRNEIYEWLFTNSKTFITPFRTMSRDTRSYQFSHSVAGRPSIKHGGLPMILAASKQVRHEAEGIFTSTTTWTFEALRESLFGAMLRRLGRERVGLVTRVGFWRDEWGGVGKGKVEPEKCDSYLMGKCGAHIKREGREVGEEGSEVRLEKRNGEEL